MPTPAARGARGAALVYGSASDVARWAAAAQYGLRFGLRGAGRWQRFAIVHGTTVTVASSEANYFALHALEVAVTPIKTDTDSF